MILWHDVCFHHHRHKTVQTEGVVWLRLRTVSNFWRTVLHRTGRNRSCLSFTFLFLVSLEEIRWRFSGYPWDGHAFMGKKQKVGVLLNCIHVILQYIEFFFCWKTVYWIAKRDSVSYYWPLRVYFQVFPDTSSTIILEYNFMYFVPKKGRESRIYATPEGNQHRAFLADCVRHMGMLSRSYPKKSPEAPPSEETGMKSWAHEFCS